MSELASRLVRGAARAMACRHRGLTLRELGARVACCVHGHAEVVAASHRKFREGVFTPARYRQVLEPFARRFGLNASNIV